MFSVSVIVDKLISSFFLVDVILFMLYNMDFFGNFFVGFFNFYIDFNWFKVLFVCFVGIKFVFCDKKWICFKICIEDLFDGKNVICVVYKDF